jgi:hypothetical protein
MADFDRYLAYCEDRHAQRLLDADDPEMATDDEDHMTRLDRLATDAEARADEDRDREMEERG